MAWTKRYRSFRKAKAYADRMNRKSNVYADLYKSNYGWWIVRVK
jgi:hypothetical protein